MRVWIDQDLCTGDGLCTDHCPEVFMLLEDGMSYVREAGTSLPIGPGQRLSIVPVARAFESDVIDAALECPGECIFVEEDATYDRVTAHEGEGDTSSFTMPSTSGPLPERSSGGERIAATQPAAAASGARRWSSAGADSPFDPSGHPAKQRS